MCNKSIMRSDDTGTVCLSDGKVSKTKQKHTYKRICVLSIKTVCLMGLENKVWGSLYEEVALVLKLTLSFYCNSVLDCLSLFVMHQSLRQPLPPTTTNTCGRLEGEKKSKTL